MIGLINMQTNNINCIVKNIKRFGYKYKIINCDSDYDDNIHKLIIPGIGNYKTCMDYIKITGIDKIINRHLVNNKKIMGICVGMQILTTLGEEGCDNSMTNGLDILKNSKTVKLNTDNILPHIGWNNINIIKTDKIFSGINIDSDFYFVHSYNVICGNNDSILGTTTYGNTTFASILKTDNIFATQFHPEKSGINGVKLIKNFLNW